MLLPVLQSLAQKLTEHGFSLAHIKAVMPLSGEALKKANNNTAITSIEL